MKKTLHEYIQRVAKFNKDAGTQLSRADLTDKEAFNEVMMLNEEVSELELSFQGQHFDKKEKNYEYFSSIDEKRQAILDDLCDIVYVALGTAVKLGLDIERGLDEVCSSNESKYTNGKLEKDVNGKILKGNNFRKPNLSFAKDIVDYNK